jgi:hypothetical protein
VSTPIDLSALSTLKPGSAVLVGMFGFMGVKSGTWKLLGRHVHWSPQDWPVPVFVRTEELTNRTFLTSYDDPDISRVIREELAPKGEQVDGPEDGSMGAGFVELRLTRLLSENLSS